MTPRKHAETAIHWFNGGQIEWNTKEDAEEDDPCWRLFKHVNEPCPMTYPSCSFRIHDPYRELKKRQKEGAVIECRYVNAGTKFPWKLLQIGAHIDDYARWEYREKPAEPPAKRKIDWSKMPVDTLCEVGTEKLYFTGKTHSDGEPTFFLNGKTSFTGVQAGEFDRPIKLIPQNWKPWFDGECPVPEGVRFDITRRDGLIVTGTLDHYCSHSHVSWSTERECSFEIIAYRIIGVAEGWEE